MTRWRALVMVCVWLVSSVSLAATDARVRPCSYWQASSLLLRR